MKSRSLPSMSPSRVHDRLEAIGMAGGFTRIADSKNVTVKRVLGGKTETIKVNTKRLEDPKGGSFQVLPGDIITVGESWY